jgi:chemotaxis protein CheZ
VTTSPSRGAWLEFPEADQGIVLEKARAIISGIENGRTNEVTLLLDELTRIRESHLFQELGRLTRQLHDVLANLERDAVLAKLADKQIPDAKERLNYVMAKSEEAAHQTLAAIEDSVPVVSSLSARAGGLKHFWVRVSQGQMEVAEFRQRLLELLDYFDTVQDDTTKINRNLTEILMAQEAQDLTGQVIRRIIELVQDLEAQLVGFMRSCSDFPSEERGTDGGGTGKLEGPQIKAGCSPDVVSNQDEVDDLLSSLGF